MTGFVSLFRLVAALMVSRMLPRFVLGATLLAAAAAVYGSGADPGEGYRALAGAADLLVLAVAALGAVLGAVSVSGDSAAGSLRAVLIRPVGRPAVVLAHGAALVLATVALYAAGLLVAAPLAGALHGYGDVRLGEFVITDAATMNDRCVRLLLLPLPALCCAPLLALAVSVLSDDVATAVVTSLVLVAGPLLFGKVIGDLPAWTFPSHALHPVAVLASLAEGDNTREGAVRSAAYLRDALLQPFLFGGACLAAAALAFHRREVKG